MNWGTPLQPATSGEEPASQRPRNSSVPSCRPTQEVGLNPERVVSLSPGSGEGQNQANTFRHRDVVGAQAGVESIARDQGETPKCTGGVKAPGETGALQSRLNPARSQLGVRLTGLAPSSR